MSIRIECKGIRAAEKRQKSRRGSSVNVWQGTRGLVRVLAPLFVKNGPVNRESASLPAVSSVKVKLLSVLFIPPQSYCHALCARNGV